VTIQTDGPSFEAVPDDARITLCYLNATESADYIAVMDVLEASINDLSPAQVASALAAAGRYLPADVVENRLESLRDWRAITGTQDTSRILRHSDLLLRNRSYARTQAGRQIHPFYPRSPTRCSCPHSTHRRRPSTGSCALTAGSSTLRSKPPRCSHRPWNHRKPAHPSPRNE